VRPAHHPGYAKPELLAERPNELWSWDVTKLKGPAKWTALYLYVILDVFSRYCVGWTVQHREDAKLAKALISQTVEQQQITRGQLTVHADRGPAMRQNALAYSIESNRSGNSGRYFSVLNCASGYGLSLEV
jgi:putative transposase